MKIKVLLFIAFLLTTTSLVQAQSEQYLSLNKECKELIKKRRYKDAYQIAQKMLPLVTTEPDTIQATIWENISKLENWIGDQKTAEKAALKSIELWEQVPARQQVIRAHLTNVYLKGQKYDLARKNQLDLLAGIAREEGEISDKYQRAFLKLGIVYEKELEHSEAEKIYQKVLKYCEKNKSSIDLYQFALYSTGAMYFNTGDIDLALPYFEDLAIFAKTNHGEEDIKYAKALLGLAAVEQAQGRLEEMEAHSLKALHIIEKSYGKGHPYATSVLYNLVLIYRSGRYKNHDKAEAIYEQILQIREKDRGKNNEDYAAAAMSFGSFYLDNKKDYKLAERYLLEADGIWRKTVGIKHFSFAKNLAYLASLYHQKGLDEKALQAFFQAKKIWEDIDKTQHAEYGNILSKLVDFYIEKAAYKKAKEYSYSLINAQVVDTSYQADENNLKGLVDQKLYVTNQVLTGLKLVHEIHLLEYDLDSNKKHLELAFEATQIGLEISNNMRKEFTSEKDKLNNLSVVAVFASLAIEAGMQLDEQVYFPLLFGYAEQNKSILLLDALKGDDVRQIGRLPDSLSQEELRLQKEKATIEKAIAEQPKGVISQSIVEKRIAISTAIQKFQKNIEINYPDYYELKYENKIATITNVQQSMEQNTCLLEYFVVDSMVYLFAVDRENRKLFKIEVTAGQLKRKIKELRQSLSNYNEVIKNSKNNFREYTTTAQWFYEKMVAPALVNKAAIKRLVIITDGELGHLPFEVFLTEPTIKQRVEYKDLPYLMNQYTISYHYSATLYSSDRNKSSSNNNHQVLAYAATYDQSDIDSTMQRKARINTIRQHLKAIPAVKKEVNALAAFLQGEFYVGAAANEGSFKEQAGNYGIIHLAMHGILNKEKPLLSSLAFTENYDTLQDNFLEADEIAQLDLNADLVVLSACETGYGKFEQGEGVVSLARSFMYAGVPSLVVSLWQVNDNSTSVIMQHFYQNLSEGQPKDEALRQAKKYYIEHAEGIATHPAYWAAFIQLGNRSPVVLQTKSSWTWFYFLGGGLFLAIGGLFLFRKRQKEK